MLFVVANICKKKKTGAPTWTAVAATVKTVSTPARLLMDDKRPGLGLSRKWLKKEMRVDWRTFPRMGTVLLLIRFKKKNIW